MSWLDLRQEDDSALAIAMDPKRREVKGKENKALFADLDAKIESTSIGGWYASTQKGVQKWKGEVKEETVQMVQDLIKKMDEMMIESAKQQSWLAKQSGGNVTIVGGNAETVVLTHRQEKDPMADVLN